MASIGALRSGKSLLTRSGAGQPGLRVLKIGSRTPAIPGKREMLEIVPVRGMGHGPRVMPNVPSGWAWQQTKNDINMYFWIGFIPWVAFWSYFNFRYGLAELKETPEGYEPEEYEYWKHPITRWFVKTWYPTKQEVHEKILAYHLDKVKHHMLDRDSRVFRVMYRENRDFIGYYYRPFTTKFIEEGYEQEGEYPNIHVEGYGTRGDPQPQIVGSRAVG